MIRELAMGALLLDAFGVINAHAQTILYSTFPAPNTGGPCISTAESIAVGAGNISDTSYQIGSAKAKLHRVIASTGPAFTVYSDDAGKHGMY